ncbi:malonate decarboxylase holo-[acyl-carrier-protein] synthase [Undibacterium sp. TJN19]|uniref:malonate decarboxylase holo-[acyl-carrier-protein] synthase n=1 Tax=Undibacterium sp. TJN19 TaxID=3413055 RepID=UPI003BF31C2C
MLNAVDNRAQYQRHDLVWLSDTAWQAIVQAQPAAGMLKQWQEQEWPAVIRRADAGTAADEVCIGLPLPPEDGIKPRVAAKVKHHDIVAHQSALSLASVIAIAPPKWQASLQTLNQQAQGAGIRLRVYGSLAWQFLTGQHYLSDNSDIDLLFRPQHHIQLRAGLALLQQHLADIPLDGEIVFPNDGAVAWKEWLLSDASQGGFEQKRVLVKAMDSVSLQTRQSLLADLPEGDLPC